MLNHVVNHVVSFDLYLGHLKAIFKKKEDFAARDFFCGWACAQKKGSMWLACG